MHTKVSNQEGEWSYHKKFIISLYLQNIPTTAAWANNTLSMQPQEEMQAYKGSTETK